MLLFAFLFIFILNFGYAGLRAFLLRRALPGDRRPILALYIWAGLMVGFMFLMVFEPPEWQPFTRQWLYLPLATAMLWNLFLLVLVPALILRVLILKRADRAAAPATPPPAPAAMSPDAISRRKFIGLASASVAPAAAIALGGYGTASSTDLRVRQFDIPIAGLPPELEGFTIAHVSDLHSGVFVGPSRLKVISDATSDLKADLVAVTGDLINRSMGEFPDAVTCIRRMKSPHGTYICEGNHDIFAGRAYFEESCTASNLKLLAYSTVTLPVRGRRLLIGGLPWMSAGFEGRPEIVSSLFPARQDGDVRILLAHHPHLFDIADSADLVLSGHTHGGQIMFGPVGLGPIRFKYCSGLFQRGNTTLIVSNGCGDWFPCRIGAPAEIGLHRLTRAPVV